MIPKLSKSAFFEGVRHFERQFQVDGDVARNRSMDRWIWEWCSYNFAAGSFHTKKLCSRLFSREVEVYWHKQRYRVFVPLFGGLRDNVHGSSMARWKARGRLPISANWTFLLAITMSRYWSKLRCLKGGGLLSTQISGEKGRPPPTNFGIGKSPCDIAWRRKIAKNFNRLSRVHQRHRQTDRRQTDGMAIAYSERKRKFTFAKKRTGQDRKKSQKGYISPICGEGPLKRCTWKFV